MSFAETVPDTVNFNVGYFDGRQQAKLWLVTDEDLDSIYSKYRNLEIAQLLWIPDFLQCEYSNHRA